MTYPPTHDGQHNAYSEGGNGNYRQYGSGGGNSEVSPQQHHFANDTVGGAYTSAGGFGGHGAGGCMMEAEDESPHGSFGTPKDFSWDDEYV